MKITHRMIHVTDLVLKGRDGVTYSVDGIVDLRAPNGDIERADVWDVEISNCYSLHTVTGEPLEVEIEGYFALGALAGRAYVLKDLKEQTAKNVLLQADIHLLNAPAVED